MVFLGVEDNKPPFEAVPEQCLQLPSVKGYESPSDIIQASNK